MSYERSLAGPTNGTASIESGANDMLVVGAIELLQKGPAEPPGGALGIDAEHRNLVGSHYGDGQDRVHVNGDHVAELRSC